MDVKGDATSMEVSITSNNTELGDVYFIITYRTIQPSLAEADDEWFDCRGQ